MDFLSDIFGKKPTLKGKLKIWYCLLSSRQIMSHRLRMKSLHWICGIFHRTTTWQWSGFTKSWTGYWTWTTKVGRWRKKIGEFLSFLKKNNWKIVGIGSENGKINEMLCIFSGILHVRKNFSSLNPWNFQCFTKF